MEHITGQTLHTHIRRKKAQGGYTLRRVPHASPRGLRWPRRDPRQGLVHGDLKPGNVMVTSNPDGGRKAIVLDFGFAQERARLSARRPGAPPDGGTPNYMSPERMRNGGASDRGRRLRARRSRSGRCGPASVPEPGYKPRAKPMRQQIMFDVPSGPVDRRDQADLPLPLATTRRCARTRGTCGSSTRSSSRRARSCRASASIPGRRRAATRSRSSRPKRSRCS
jgi:serine/threonine protein kinase